MKALAEWLLVGLLGAVPGLPGKVIGGYDKAGNAHAVGIDADAGAILVEFASSHTAGAVPGLPGTVIGGYDGVGNAHAVGIDNDAGAILVECVGGTCGSSGPGADTGVPTFLYVATTGSDANACTAAAPCLTIQAAVNQVPKYIRHPYIVKVAAGVYGAGAYVDGFTFGVSGGTSYIPNADAGAYLAIEGTMVTASAGGLMSGSIASATAGTGPDQGTCNQANWSTFTVTGAGWTVNALTGRPVCVTSGAFAGECSIIDTNTATTATLVGIWNLGTPNPGDAFQIQTWGTVIDGGLPRPPGASGLQGYADQTPNGFPAAFFVAGNNAQSYISGYGSGYFSDLTSQSLFANASYPEPQISINSFNFQNGDNMVSVGASGPEIFDFSHNQVSAGIAVNARGGASVQVVGNASYQDDYGDFMYWTGAYGVAPVQMVSSGDLIGSGNYCTQLSSGGYSACFSVGGAGLLSQNVMAESDAQFTEFGAVYGSPNATIHSLCNEFYGLLSGLAFYGFAINGVIASSGDEFDQDSYAIHISNFGKLELATPAPTGSGTHIGVFASAGSAVQLGGVSVSGLGDAGDIVIDGRTFSENYLVNDGGLFWNGTYQGINPGAFVNLQSGSQVYK